MTTLLEIWSEKKDLPQWAAQPFTGFCLDSRKVQSGNIFIALKGVNSDIEKTPAYMQQALQQGAIGVLTEIENVGGNDANGAGIDKINLVGMNGLNLVRANCVRLNHNVDEIFYVPELRQILGTLQQHFLQAQHAQSLARAVAVTGTNGKTTVARLIAELLTLLGQPTAVMGTTGNGILPNLTASTHTTLDALQFQQAYYQYSQQGAKFLALEASSHGIEQGRLAGTAIEVAVFTNLTRDHLDYHLTLENYAQAKAGLFDFPKLKHAVINASADYAELMLAHAKQNPAQPQISLYSTEHDTQVDYHVRDLQFSLSGAMFRLETPSGQYTVSSSLLGRFNVDNVLAAMICVEKLGFSLADIVARVPQLQGAAGRMQAIGDVGRLFIVDYAHTPDAMEQVLQSLKHHVTGRLWVVFGCGGDRDRGKRPLMTQAALTYADHVILTSDNPRTEPLAQIFADMQANIDFSGYQVDEIDDRRIAIKTVVQQAQAGDIVLIAGKGHENYQEIDGIRHWFDDVVEVQAAIDSQHCRTDSAYSAL